MKTAISIPDPIFREADELAARLGLSRSELYVRAIKRYVSRRKTSKVTEALDAIYGERESTLDPSLAALQARSLPGGDW